jgi:ribosomal protein L11 methyltransferase
MVDAKFMEGGTNIHYLEEWLAHRTSADPPGQMLALAGGHFLNAMHELSLLCPEDRVETVSDALDALDALSVSSRTPTRRPTPSRRCSASPACRRPRKAGSAAACGPVPRRGPPEARTCCCCRTFCRLPGAGAPVPEQDWVRLTQSQFEPVDITPEFWIVPTWHEPPEPPRSASAWTRAWPSAPAPTHHPHVPALDCAQPASLGRVLDYGCGSGILAIGAAKFGARRSMRWTSIPRPWNPPLNARPMACS